MLRVFFSASPASGSAPKMLSVRESSIQSVSGFQNKAAASQRLLASPIVCVSRAGAWDPPPRLCAPRWRTPRPSPPQSPSRPPPATVAVTSAPRPKLTQSSGPGPRGVGRRARLLWGAGACGQRSRAPPPQPPAWAGRGRRAERRARSAKVRRRRGAGGVDREGWLWEARAAVPLGEAVGDWREGFPRMERPGSCAQTGKMGPRRVVRSWGARSKPGPSL